MVQTNLAAPGAGTRFAALLESLTRLQQLTRLVVNPLGGSHGMLGPTGSLVSSAPAEAFADITASSSLQSLHLTGATWDTRAAGRRYLELPPGAWQSMFAPGRQRTALQVLELENLVMRPGDIEALATCCPGLRRLSLPVLYGGPGAPSALHALAQLSELRELEVLKSYELPATALLPLTGLRQLERLDWSVCRKGRPTYSGTPETCLSFFYEADTDTAPDVWQQLLVGLRKYTDDAATQQADQQAPGGREGSLGSGSGDDEDSASSEE